MDTRQLVTSTLLPSQGQETPQSKLNFQGTFQAQEAIETTTVAQPPKTLGGIWVCVAGKSEGVVGWKRHDLEVDKLTIWADDWPLPRLMANRCLVPLLGVVPCVGHVRVWLVVEFIQPRTWHPWDGQAKRATGSVAALDDDIYVSATIW